MNRMTKLAICLLAMAMATVSWADHHGKENARKAMARAWIEASNTGKAEFIAFVERFRLLQAFSPSPKHKMQPLTWHSQKS